MPRYALLVRESANRVYAGDAPRLLAAELAAVAGPAGIATERVEVTAIGGVDYVVATAPELDETQRFVLSNLSACHALFELHDDGRLAPCEVAPLRWFADDLVTMQRYPGKTNEQFTHLLVNVAVAASTAAHERSAQGKQVRLLDPVAGRGSTLNRALLHGFDATGIEIVEADVDQYRTFVTNYFQEHRIKHRVTRERVRKGPLAGTWRFGVTIAGRQELLMVRGDSERAAELLPGRSHDVVVGDLPYGVQHRVAGGGAPRSPGELVASSIEGWVALLRRGGSLALSWNVRTLPHSELAGSLAAAGLEIVEHPASFEHGVDRTIRRDLIVATR